MNMGLYAGKLTGTSVLLDEESINWINKQIEKKNFFKKSEAIRGSIHIAKRVLEKGDNYEICKFFLNFPVTKKKFSGHMDVEKKEIYAGDIIGYYIKPYKIKKRKPDAISLVRFGEYDLENSGVRIHGNGFYVIHQDGNIDHFDYDHVNRKDCKIKVVGNKEKNPELLERIHIVGGIHDI